MKTLVKYISNFKFNNNASDDNLQIEYFENINLDNGEITSELKQGDLFYDLFGEVISNQIKNINNELLNKTIEIIPYEYFDEIINNKILRLFILTNNYELYELDNESYLFKVIHQFTNKPNIIFNKSNLYYFDKNECMIVDLSNLVLIENLPQINSYVEYNNQLFFTTDAPFNIFQCEEIEFKNLSNNLNIYNNYKTNLENGEILKVILLKNKLYAITEYTILKYDSDYDKFIKQNDLKLCIYKNTIEIIDNKVLFYTTNGLYSFDGNNIELTSNSLLDINKNAKSVCFNQNYYIFSPNHVNFLYKFNLQNNYLIPLKLNNIKNFYVISSNSIYNLCICQLIENTYKNITLYNLNSNSFIKQQLAFKSSFFGSAKTKQIKNIILKSEGEFLFTIKSDISETCFYVSSPTSFRNLSLNGNIFTIEISTQNYFKLKSILIEYSEVGE